MVGIPKGITISAIGLKICAIAAGIKKYKSISKKKKKKHHKTVLLAKSKSNGIKVLISKTLIDSVVNHGEFVLINNVLREYDKIKEETQFKYLIRPLDLARIVNFSNRKVFNSTRKFIEDFIKYIMDFYKIFIK